MRSLFCALSTVGLMLATSDQAHAQWIANPVPFMPGTRIPSPPIYIAPPLQPNPLMYAPIVPPMLTVVPDPTNPAQYLNGMPQAALSPAQQEYARRFIAIDEIQLLSPYTGEPLQSRVQPYEGTYRRSLGLQEFYQRIGGDELAEQYRSRRRARIGLIATGAVAATVGGILAITGGTLYLSSAFSSDCRSTSLSCTSPSRTQYGTLLGVGIAVAVVGGVLWPIGLSIKPEPVPPYRARQLADSHNVALREQLGLATQRVLPAPAPAPPPAPASGPAPQSGFGAASDVAPAPTFSASP